MFVQALTDNRNPAASDVRSTFSRNGGNLGEPGISRVPFAQKGYVLAVGSEDEVIFAALDAGAEDVQPRRDQHEVICAPGDIDKVVTALESSWRDDRGIRSNPASTDLDQP